MSHQCTEDAIPHTSYLILTGIHTAQHVPQDSHWLGGFWQVFVTSHTDSNDTSQSNMTSLMMYDVHDDSCQATRRHCFMTSNDSHLSVTDHTACRWLNFVTENYSLWILVTLSVTWDCRWLDPHSTVGEEFKLVKISSNVPWETRFTNKLRVSFLVCFDDRPLQKVLKGLSLD